MGTTTNANPRGSFFANPHGAATTWVVWANTWLVTCWFISIPLQIFALFFGSRWARANRPILTIGLYVIRRVSAQGCPKIAISRQRFDRSPRKPILGAWIGISKPNAQNVKTHIIATSAPIPTKFCTVQRPPNTFRLWYGPNRRITNPILRTAAILKAGKSLYLSSGSTYYCEIWLDDTHWSY